MYVVRTDHRYFQLMFPDFLTGKLETNRRLELESHLALCGDCARDLEELKTLEITLRSIRPADPPAYYFTTVLPRVREAIEGKAPRNEDSFMARFLAPIAALALLAIALLQVSIRTEGDLRAVLGGLKSDELAEVAVEEAEYQSLYLIHSTESLASTLPEKVIDQQLAETILTDGDDTTLLSMTELTDQDVTIILERLGERKIL